MAKHHHQLSFGCIRTLHGRELEVRRFRLQVSSVLIQLSRIERHCSGIVEWRCYYPRSVSEVNILQILDKVQINLISSTLLEWLPYQCSFHQSHALLIHGQLSPSCVFFQICFLDNRTEYVATMGAMSQFPFSPSPSLDLRRSGSMDVRIDMILYVSKESPNGILSFSHFSCCCCCCWWTRTCN